MARRPYGLGCEWIVIAWHEKYRNAWTTVFLERLRKSFPEVGERGRFVEKIPDTQYSVHVMTTCKV